MDRILKAEGDSPDNYKVSKQADVCMLFFLLTTKEIEELFTGLGYPFHDSMVRKNIDYYLQRTTHGSTLSKMIFSYVLQPYDRKSAWDMFVDSARADIDDVQQGTTGEGVHLALMAGSLYTCIRMYAGVDISQSILEISPDLPETIKKIRFSLQFRGVMVIFSVSHQRVKASASRNMFPVKVQGMIMFAGEKPFKKRISGQPLSTEVSRKCEQCGPESPESDGDSICRICGKAVCDKCLVQHIGWSDTLKLDISIKTCAECASDLKNFNCPVPEPVPTNAQKGLTQPQHHQQKQQHKENQRQQQKQPQQHNPGKHHQTP